MQVNGNGCEDSPSRYPIMPARTPGVAPASTTASYTLPGTPTLLEEHSTIKSESCRNKYSSKYPQCFRKHVKLFFFFLLKDKVLNNLIKLDCVTSSEKGRCLLCLPWTEQFVP